MKDDKRIRINKKMVAWSNGQETHIIPSLADELYVGYVRRRDDYRERVDQGYVATGYPDATYNRERSRLLEELSDRLWEQGRHIEAMSRLLDSACVLFDDNNDWYDFFSISFFNPNWQQFRYVMAHVRDRLKQDPRLRTMVEDSQAAWWYREMFAAIPRIDLATGIIP